MNIYAEAVKDVSMILLIIGSAGILKQIFIDSGAGKEIAAALQEWRMPVLLPGVIVTAVFKTLPGIGYYRRNDSCRDRLPLTSQTNVDANLMVLSIGAGSLFCSHVNDTGWDFQGIFWRVC